MCLMECGWSNLGFILRGVRVEYPATDTVSLSDATFSPTGSVRVAGSGLRFFALLSTGTITLDGERHVSGESSPTIRISCLAHCL